MRVLKAITWSNKAATYEEGEAEPCTCQSSTLAGKLMRPAWYGQVGEADGGNICSLTVQCGLYYLLIFTDLFDLYMLMDVDATYSFVSL